MSPVGGTSTRSYAMMAAGEIRSGGPVQRRTGGVGPMPRLGGGRPDRGGTTVQTVLVLALIGLVVYEAIAIGVATFQVDDSAREVAAVAATSYSRQQDLARAQEAAADRAEQAGVELLSVEVQDDRVFVEVRQMAKTAVVHRIDAIAGAATPSSSASVGWSGP